MSTRIGILHPGQMGASVGAAARVAGAVVAWIPEGRSDATKARAAAAGLVECPSLDDLASESEVLISVCPPSAALEVAHSVAALGYTGTFVDANAIAPATARHVADVVEEAGGRFVDGGIVGPPARDAGTTRIYLSGVGAASVSALFEGSALDAVVLEGAAGSASALKACYAAWTKGSAALLMAIRALAVAEQVEGPLLDEWSISQPDLEARSETAVRVNAFKAWRFAGEMQEIAAAFAGNELPSGFHRAAAEVYQRLAGFKDAETAPTVQMAVEQLLVQQP